MVLKIQLLALPFIELVVVVVVFGALQETWLIASAVRAVVV
jgi:hypothetical protein